EEGPEPPIIHTNVLDSEAPIGPWSTSRLRACPLASIRIATGTQSLTEAGTGARRHDRRSYEEAQWIRSLTTTPREPSPTPLRLAFRSTSRRIGLTPRIVRTRSASGIS